MNKNATIYIGCDHAGYPYKQAVIGLLEERGYQVEDQGTNAEDSVDYPDYVHPVAQAVQNGTAKLGIIMCGSGNGVAMTANKYKGVRAAICWENELAELARLHNDANIISIPVRFVSKDLALKMVETFLDTDFEGGRHQRRVSKIDPQD
jgi:ribose 5-phosphate isomerase B